MDALYPFAVVLSQAGHDRGNYFVVMAVEQEYVLLCDGKLRRVEKPKRKKIKHVRFLGAYASSLTEKQEAGEEISNKDIRKALMAFANGADDVIS